MAKFLHNNNTGESLLLPFKDYPLSGEYFLTVCTRDNVEHFGAIDGGRVQLSPAGLIVKEEWKKISSVYPDVRLDAFVVVPNLIRGILLIGKSKMERSCSPGSIVGQFKSVSAKRVHDAGFRDFRWQPGHYEHIIRDGNDFRRIREYIAMSPEKWKPGDVVAEEVEITTVHAKG